MARDELRPRGDESNSSDLERGSGARPGPTTAPDGPPQAVTGAQRRGHRLVVVVPDPSGHGSHRRPAASGATIINIGSIAADKGAGAYGAAKAGLASWTVDLAAQLGPDGITANTLAPGYVADTEFFRDRLDDTARQAMADAAPTRRASTPDDIAASTYFLASPAARQITGQVLHVNGGEHRTR